MEAYLGGQRPGAVSSPWLMDNHRNPDCLLAMPCTPSDTPLRTPLAFRPGLTRRLLVSYPVILWQQGMVAVTGAWALSASHGLAEEWYDLRECFPRFPTTADCMFFGTCPPPPPVLYPNFLPPSGIPPLPPSDPPKVDVLTGGPYPADRCSWLRVNQLSQAKPSG